MKHTILGAGGSIGNALTYELLKNGQSVRLVSRSKYQINGADSFKADITSFNETFESVKGSDLPALMQRVIKKTSANTKLYTRFFIAFFIISIRTEKQ